MSRTILTIAGVDYDNVERPAARVRIDALDLAFGGGYSSCQFTEIGGHPLPTWHDGQSVEVTWIGDDDVPHLVFSGTIGDVPHSPSPTGWMIGYRAISRKHLADHVPVTGFDRAGEMIFNRSPEDPSYTSSEAGLELGAIIRIVLTAPGTAAALDACGVGNYTSLSPPILPAATEADLDLLTAVPMQPVGFGGEGVLNQVEQVLQHWMPKWVLDQRPDGTLRFKDTTDTATTFVPVTIVLPNATVASDTANWPTIRKTTSRCATRVVIRGASDVEATVLSLRDGTLAPAWTQPQEDSWTLSDFTSPKDAYSEGAITAITGNSATIDPDDAARAWGANFWSGREGWIYMTSLLAEGIEIHQQRPVVSNTACAAGGSCTVTWDASWPIDSEGYTRYRLIGGAGGNADVGRLYTVREPATGNTGLDTFVGSHLARRSSLPIKVANNSGFISVHYSQGIVCWSSSGEPPYTEPPVSVEVEPTNGRFRFTQPTQTIFGAPGTLELGYPESPAEGLPGDVRVVAMYARGALEAVAPANTGTGGDVPAYEGTAYSGDGVQITKTIDLPSWTNKGDRSRLVELAQQHLDALKDSVYEGSIDWYGAPPWDWWDSGTCVNFSVPPLTGLWEDINAPIRSIRLTWPQGEGMIHKFTIGFSNERRPHSGDDLFIPAAFSHDGIEVKDLYNESRTFAGMPADHFDSGMDALNGSMGMTGNGSEMMLGGPGGSMGGTGMARGIGAGDPFAAALERSGARGESQRPARPRGEPRDAATEGAARYEAEQRGAAERDRLASGTPPARQPDVTLPPADRRTTESLPPHELSPGEQAASERGRSERGRLDRGEAPPRRPPVTLPPADSRTTENLPPHEQSPGEQAASERGRAERERLDRLNRGEG